jgi:hypothetical protein
VSYPLIIARAVLAAIPLLAPTGTIGPMQTGRVETGPVLDAGAQSCDQYPFTVNCHANSNFPHQYYYACFPTLCDAVAAGAYQCRKKFKSTCEIE